MAWYFPLLSSVFPSRAVLLNTKCSSKQGRGFHSGNFSPDLPNLLQISEAGALLF